MQEVYVQMGDSVYPIRVRIPTTTFLDVYYEIENIYCGYEMDAIVRHFETSYPITSEPLAAKGISAGHIFQLPMIRQVIYR